MILTQVAPATVSPNVPIKTEFWMGYDMWVEAYFDNDPLTAEELASMSDAERRGYEYAQRCAADTETYEYLSNYNAYGDRTEY